MFLEDKGRLHLTINQYHSAFFDSFFKYITYLGDGTMVIIVTVTLLFIKYKFALFIGLSNFVTSLFTQILKNFIFPDMLRPKKFFEGIAELYFVPGVENYSYNTFPSGHTTVAFTLYFCLALIIENPLIKILLFILSLVASFSRVYLSQHFFNDIYAGSLIGVIFSILIYYFLERSARIKGQSILDKSLISPKK